MRRFAEEHIDAAAIDRNADIPPDVIAGLGQLGVLGMTAPKEYGGRGFSQLGYCQIMEVIGGHCCLDGGVRQRPPQHRHPRACCCSAPRSRSAAGCRDLVSGEKLGRLRPDRAARPAPTPPTCRPPPRRPPTARRYILNGEKRYITNGGIAQVLTVMARTPVPGSSETKVTAFLVTPDMPGFEVVEARMPKCGIRGTATARLAFHDMPVPARERPRPARQGPARRADRARLRPHHVRRQLHRRRQDLPARAPSQHAKTRVQFKQPLGEFELVKKKIAFMAANAFAMEATTSQCAAFIDRGAEDYMLETAMLKVFVHRRAVADRQRHDPDLTAARPTSPTSRTSA